MFNLQLSAGEVAIHHSPNPQGVTVFQFSRQCRIRKILITNGTSKTKYCLRTHRSSAAVCARRIGSSMNHGVTNLNAGRITVEKDAADFMLQDFEQVGEFPEVFFGAVNRGGEMAAETSSGIQDFLFVGEANQ